MINSRDIVSLDLHARKVCEEHIRQCDEAGIEIIVTSTYRDAEAQDSLYAIGRTVQLERKPVTNARAGQSWHNFRCAWDVVPIVGGKAVWNDYKVWERVIEIGKSCGAEAGADWQKFPDRPHFQVRPAGLTLAQAALRFQQKQTIFTEGDA